ncbi:MAG TPA: response regulator [Gammaproteobacteria bacterium]|nr:response regulator [Gammaproteobacteria bacterium]
MSNKNSITAEKKTSNEMHQNFILTHLNYAFRMPIIGILKSAQMICKDNSLTADLHEHINNINNSANELLHNIDRISNLVLSEIVAINSGKVSSNSEIENTQHLIKRILLVEDNEIEQKIISTMLKEIGYEVDIAASGQQALDKLRQVYDVILMDIGLPDITGLTVTSKIRTAESSQKKIPIFALTALQDEESKRECLNVGMNAMISKPVTADVLRNYIERSLQSQKPFDE